MESASRLTSGMTIALVSMEAPAQDGINCQFRRLKAAHQKGLRYAEPREGSRS